MVVPSAKVLHATGYYLTDDGDGEGAFSGVAREVSGPDLDHGRTVIGHSCKFLLTN